ncbi:MAG TPA: TAT-variant-translocated molybdopterin oxidoreductase, partial [Candidatus Polarisedimenticolaceae bacterium]|nr:TAT-variant-translocated molybdopterin oxidoreductase [Candidatus Polarisedimenticolaceae bacterium]
MSKRYWRSVEELAGDPAVQQAFEREFPEGASELPADIPRRELFKWIGATLALAGVTACRRPVERIVPFVEPPEELIPGVPLYYATTMPLGHAAYGLVVESHEGRPTKIEGNELHPATRGASSAWIQAALLGLYDPDRSAAVLHAGERKTWTDFVAAWTELDKQHAANGGSGLGLLTRSFASPTLARLHAAFRQRYPQATVVAYEPAGDENIHEGTRGASGAARQPVADLERARVILALDCDFLLTETDAVRHARGFADGRRVAAESDEMNRLWAVEGVHSLTGANAD